MSARVIPKDALDAQVKASNPESSAFVSANAGSGKTFVLVNRVIRLLLSGVPPEKILCVTFTKAAAANMAERVFTKLGGWVTLDDAALDREITSAGVSRVDTKIRMRARELFACALETPGGLKVQTIHALCTRLLQQFPFEANVPARFSVIDDRDQNDMMERASLSVLLHAAAEPGSAEGRALANAMTSAADVTFRDVIREASLSRDKFLAWIDHAGDTPTALMQLSSALGVDPADSSTTVEIDIVDGPNLPRARWKKAAEIFETGAKTDIANGATLRAALMLETSAQVEEFLSLFMTATGTPRKSLATKAIATSRPDLVEALRREAERIAPLLERRRAVAMRERTESLLVIAAGVAANYSRQKQARGLLDYDDLIDKTLEMLDRVSSSWVHYKLDRGVDHVLIDEAQDTSPRQWAIVSHLISEFTSGEGARDGVKRTVFAVGDEKQSIFSFQGARPKEFDQQGRMLKKQFTDAGLTFEPVKFNTSFRSGAAILQSVDFVFRNEAIYRSIHAVDNGYPIHQSLADAGPSLIDLWDLQEANPRQSMEGWRAPFDATSETSPEVRLAQRVQAEIRALISNGTQTGPMSKRRALRYGDILILVRRRGKAFNAIIHALKHADIPVAGADRLKLTEHIAIIDLMNLADALLLPQDDLALAVALKSPLFSLDDDDLFKLAWQRTGSLRSALAEQSGTDGKMRDANARLLACEARFVSETPFTFFAWLLGGDGGRARILRRLGHEANDALDEFLELSLGYERKAPATLQGFVAWLRAADTEVKRDMEITRDEVRVMTVHGAKGLEAPVVFLVDTTSSPADSQRLSLIHLPPANAAIAGPDTGPGVVVWAGKKGDDPAAVLAARAALITDTDDEYRRLLYVAMTRAADRLIVGGCMPGNRSEIQAQWWYDLIRKGLEASGLHAQEVMTPTGPAQRYSRAGDAMPAAAASDEPAVKDAPVVLPAWLRETAKAEPRGITVLHPSDAGDDGAHGPLADDPVERAAARKHGTLQHRLLQSLPDVAPDRRFEAASRYLARNTDETVWPEPARDKLAATVLALIADERFEALFAPGSRAEISIVGRVRRGGETVQVSGQIDRLVVTEAEVLIVDFKTNRRPPRTEADVPPAYIRQLALYRAVLTRLYPGKPVRALLLWTETPELMEISTRALDAEQNAAI